MTVLKVVPLPLGGEPSGVAYMLRKVALMIERGEIPTPSGAILVVETESATTPPIDVYGISDIGDATRGVGIMARALQQMTNGLQAEAKITRPKEDQ